jgi:hypothetical protein
MKPALAFFLAGAAIIIALRILVGCQPSVARPAAYGAELVACSKSSATLADSITCENSVRARYGRPLRDAGVQ